MSFRGKKLRPFILNVILALMIAVPMDIMDYIAVLYSIPALLQVSDVLAVVVLFKLLGPIALLGFADLLPVLGLWPTWTTIVILYVVSRLVFKRGAR